MIWTYDHPTKGTCNDAACPAHGRCHCGCGKFTHHARQNRMKGRLGKWTKGNPTCFLAGHAAWLSPGWKAYGVPIDRVRPLLRFLQRRHGGIEHVPPVVGIPRSTIINILYKASRKTVAPETAQKIVAAVLPLKAPSYIWQQADDLPARRHPRPEERGIPSPKQLAARENQRRTRANKKLPRLPTVRYVPTNAEHFEHGCPHCGKRFLTSKGLNVHARQQHNDSRPGYYGIIRRHTA